MMTTNDENYSLLMKELPHRLHSLLEELIIKSKLKENQILVVGCSTSEIQGASIGSGSNINVAELLWPIFEKIAKERHIYFAFQCCEHLNRAIVIERVALPMAYVCNVVPKTKAGGSMATTAYCNMEDPIVVESLQADAGIDIGDTFIGMHMKPVTVPVRLTFKELGFAHITACRVRPKFIGGSRASYDEELL